MCGFFKISLILKNPAYIKINTAFQKKQTLYLQSNTVVVWYYFAILWPEQLAVLDWTINSPLKQQLSVSKAHHGLGEGQ